MRYNIVAALSVRDLGPGDLFCADQLPNVFLQLVCCDQKIATASVLYDAELSMEDGEVVKLLPSDLVRRAEQLN